MIAEIATWWYTIRTVLSVFISFSYFKIKKAQFTCMAVWFPYKTACVDNRLLLIIVSLHYMVHMQTQH